jgi:hypothetical protein
MTTGKSENRRARTCRALHRGTTKCLSQETQQAAPIGACLLGLVTGLEIWSFSVQPVAKSYAKLLVKLSGRYFIFVRGELTNCAVL